MGRYIGPKFKQSRREGEKLDERGERASGPKSPMVKRNYPPGMHGLKGTGRISEYGIRLRSKQKAKRIYGLLERQFRKYYDQASRVQQATDELLFQQLERRLDNVVFRLGFAPTRRSARQMINHRKFLVNGKIVNVPSYQVRVNDAIVPTDRARKQPLFVDLPKTLQKYDVPSWLSLEKKTLEARVVSLPTTQEIPHTLDLQKIIEFYSR